MRVKRFVSFGLVAVGSVLAGAPVFAQGTTYTPPASIDFTTIITPATMATGAAVLGGAALVAAMTLGGGFRTAHKLYRWVFAKIG